MSRVLVVIPAYNEEQGVGEVIRQVRGCLPDADVLIVDDGSTDRTAQKVLEEGAILLSLPYNLGIGGAVQTGYKYAAQAGYEIVARVDADGQHAASGLSRLIEHVRAGDADVVVGSRYARDSGYRGSFLRFLGTKIFSALVSIAIRQRVTDATSGFIAMKRPAVQYCARDYPLDYPEVESLITLHRAGFRIKEVPVQMNPRRGGKSSINWTQATYYMVKVLIGVFVGSIRRAARRKEAV